MKTQSPDVILDAAETRFRALHSAAARNFSFSAFVSDGNAVTVDIVSPGMFLLTAFSGDGLCLGCKSVWVESASPSQLTVPVRPARKK